MDERLSGSLPVDKWWSHQIQHYPSIAQVLQSRKLSKAQKREKLQPFLDKWVAGVDTPERKRALEISFDQVLAVFDSMSKAKRLPLLADRYLASNTPREENLIPKKYRELVRDKLREAKRFVLDDEATRYIGEFQRKCPEAVAAAQEFAIPPFETMYIEFPARPMFEAASGLPSDADADTRVGYLFVGPRVYVLAETHYPSVGGGKHLHLESALMPLVYRLNQPLTEAEEKEHREHDSQLEQIDKFFWGRAWDELDPAVARKLREQHGFNFLAPFYLEHPTVYQSVLDSAAGEMRRILAMLLFLNQTSKVRYDVAMPPQQGMIGHKAGTLMTHSVIKIKVNPIERLVQIYPTGMGKPKRLHDCRGHFCHDHIWRDGCTLHDPVETPGKHDRQWKCLKCGGKRWWKREHKRGGKRVPGKVIQSYEVTKQ